MFCKWCSICDSTDLAKRTISDNILQNKAYEITKNLKHDGYQSGLGGIVYTFFDKIRKRREIMQTNYWKV